jgi:hypothetical protein
MARRNKLITREFNLTVGEVLTVNLENRETNVLEFSLTGKYEKAETILDVMKKQIGGNLVPVQIISFENKTKLFGITEENFLANAIELDKETRKPL